VAQIVSLDRRYNTAAAVTGLPAATVTNVLFWLQVASALYSLDSEESAMHAEALQHELTQQTASTSAYLFASKKLSNGSRDYGGGHTTDANKCTGISAKRLTGSKSIHSCWLLLVAILLSSWVASSAADPD
jgi:hypothetical protein